MLYPDLFQYAGEFQYILLRTVVYRYSKVMNRKRENKLTLRKIKIGILIYTYQNSKKKYQYQYLY